MIRRLAERLSRDRVLCRRLPRRFGRAPVFVSPDSALSYWRGDLEAIGLDLFDFAECFLSPGDTVWDLGANVGLFTFAAASVVGPSGRVLAIEPDGFCVSLLRRTSALHIPERATVEVVPVAASANVDLVAFHVADRGRSSSHLADASGNSQAGGVRASVSVPSVTLDWLAQRRPAPAVLKIDVEGAEGEVLLGSSNLLENIRPVILCEVGEQRALEVTRLFKERSYCLFDWESRAPVPVEHAPFNTLAIPEEDVAWRVEDFPST
jgi:FkbM family methyltransferase